LFYSIIHSGTERWSAFDILDASTWRFSPLAKPVFMGVEGDIPDDCMLWLTSKDFRSSKRYQMLLLLLPIGDWSVDIVIFVLDAEPACRVS
jgi:hypothetical protein